MQAGHPQSNCILHRHLNKASVERQTDRQAGGEGGRGWVMRMDYTVFALGLPGRMSEGAVLL